MNSVFDQLNPLSTPNLIIYFSWIFVYVFTATAVWRSQRRVLRLCCFLVNQIFSVGLLISIVNVVIPAITFWMESLALIVATGAVSMWLFRDRSKKERKAAAKAGKSLPESSEEGGSSVVTGRELDQLTHDWLSDNLQPSGKEKSKGRE